MLDSLPLSRKQIRSIADATARINIWHGAIRSGKTIASLMAFLIMLAAAPSSGLIIVVGRSLQTIERNVLDPLQDEALFGPIARLVVHTRGATTATILGRTVHLIGAADTRAEGRLRGLTACLAYVDEATLIPRGFWNQLLGRLSVPGARLLATTNPDNPGHWLKKDFLDRAGDLDLRSWHFTLDDNPALDPAYVASLKAEYVGLWYRRFISGHWVQSEGAIYESFDIKRHVVRTLPRIERWLCDAIDYGTANPYADLLIGVGTDRRLYVVSEYRHDSRLAHAADDGCRVLAGAQGLAGAGATATDERGRGGSGVDNRRPVGRVVHRAVAPGRGVRGDAGRQHGAGWDPHSVLAVLDGGSAGARVRAGPDRRGARLLVGRRGGRARRGQADQGQRSLV